MSFRTKLVMALPALISVLAAADWCSAQQLALTPYRPSGIYNLGERVGWTATLPQGTAPAGGYAYVVKKNNQDVIKTGALDLSSGRAAVEVILNEPAMVYVEVSPRGSRGRPGAGPAGEGGGTETQVVGAAVAPEKLRPSVPRPADFDSFWAAKIHMLESVPENAVLTPSDSGKPDVEFATIRMDNVNGAHVHGQLARPKKPGTFPALLILQWASPPYPLQKQWVTDRAAEGWLALNIEPHDVLPDQPQAYYDALPESLKHYESIGREDRDKNYFLQMYLADYRAVEYLASRPDWDGRTLVVMGTSMGGQQSLCVAGLNSKITHVIVNEPAGCDTNGSLHGRASGYPNWPPDNAKAMQTARYFDAVNFASRITVPSLVAMGFVDTVTPPVGIWIAFNQIRGPKEAVPMVESPHNHLATPAQQRPFTVRSAQWLDTLVRGGKVKPDPTRARRGDGPPPRAGRSEPRTDRNSQTAHAQLVAKARKGGIDVYFVGDSITRRWGTSDVQYERFLANWRQNFFGWNAANFGWGGDTTRNILWRLRNGELDGVSPKIIVLLAGTNDVGNAAPRGDEDSRVADVAEGIRAIVDICHTKAPNATLVLMGITPRNDAMAVMPVIDRINERIAKFADGKKIRYVNINDRLADRDGRFFEGMADRDGLHLDAKGYQVWADALRPIFTELLGPPAKDDHAPPPTGDPSATSRPATRLGT